MSSPIDVGRLKAVMGHFATGVTIVAGIDGEGAPAGFTAQTFHSLSFDPPLVLVCPGKSVSSWPKIQPTGKFCVSILSDQQEAVCLSFATKGADKFSSIGWRPAPVTGSPIINDALAWIDCEIQDEYDGGDHLIVVGRVVDLDVDYQGQPLVFYRAGFGRFEP